MATRLAFGSDVRPGEAGSWLLGDTVVAVVTDVVASGSEGVGLIGVDGVDVP